MLGGLTSSQAENLLKEHGPNALPEKKANALMKIARKFISPISGMLIAAALLSFFIGKLFDSFFILLLLLMNVGITLWQENKADSAIEKLNEQLTQKIKTFRDQEWKLINTTLLVPGDVIHLSSGDVVPADGTLLEVHNVSINESAVTGESLPVDKKVSDTLYSGSIVASGIAVANITATGASTHFGKTVVSLEKLKKSSLLEKDIIVLSKFLTFLSLLAVVVLSSVFLFKHAPFLELLTLDLSLIVAGIPTSLPTVMTLIIEFGVINLSKKNAIVRRISALEDLANINFLLTDKTGTLTNNKISIKDVYGYNKFNHSDVLEYAAIIASHESDNQIDKAILEKAKDLHVSPLLSDFKEVSFVPADSERKRSTLVLKKNNLSTVITIGAPQIVQKYCKQTIKEKEEFDRQTVHLAKHGYRTLAVAIGKDSTEEKNLELVGLLALSDSLRNDAVSVVTFMQDSGINVSVITGDNRAIATEIAHELSLDNKKIVIKDELDKLDFKTLDKDFFKQVSVYAEVLPEDKLKIIQYAKKFYTVAANGDGVNDLPAIKAADVGMAVKNAVSALKSTADIVLLSDGISVIKDAIIESRIIFERVYTYTLYRLSESLRLIVTIAVLGLLYGKYPLSALQIILIALLNDIPIITLAFDRVKVANSPRKINVKKRFFLSSVYGVVGIMNSLIMFYIATQIWHLSWPVVETLYFLKLTVSGHMLIYVAHTKVRWFSYLPSKEVIWATSVTQLLATACAFTGFLMPGRLNITEVIFVWIWSFFWMQVADLLKGLRS